ncbi:MAG: hypothetical protein QM767_06095 [Anaeromyxobacter sp.]
MGFKDLGKGSATPHQDTPEQAAARARAAEEARTRAERSTRHAKHGDEGEPAQRRGGKDEGGPTRR